MTELRLKFRIFLPKRTIYHYGYSRDSLIEEIKRMVAPYAQGGIVREQCWGRVRTFRWLSHLLALISY
jgi:hypothetical protein